MARYGRPANRNPELEVSELRERFFIAMREECREMVESLREACMEPCTSVLAARCATRSANEKRIAASLGKQIEEHSTPSVESRLSDLIWGEGGEHDSSSVRAKVQKWAGSNRLTGRVWALRIALECVWFWATREEAAKALEFPWEFDGYAKELFEASRLVELEMCVAPPEREDRTFEKYKQRVWAEVERKAEDALRSAWGAWGKAPEQGGPFETQRLLWKGRDDQVIWRAVVRHVCKGDTWEHMGRSDRFRMDVDALRKAGKKVMAALGFE